MAWLALGMKDHWRQVRSTPLDARTRRSLRALGAVALALAWVLCVCADHVSMASLVWVMGLSASALLVALLLAWRPHSLSWLVSWVEGGAPAG